MAITGVIGARFDDMDKAALKELAARLQRSQSDVLRGLVRTTLEILREQDARESARPRGKHSGKKSAQRELRQAN